MIALAPLLFSALAGTTSPTVELGGHRARFTTEEGAPRLVLDVEVINRHVVPVSHVEVGLLAADSDSALERARELGQTYLDAKRARDGVTALRGVADAQLGPGDTKRATLTFEWPNDAPEPQAFVTHVLGYQLVGPALPLLLSMLATDRPADERAALGVFGLMEDAVEQAQARARLAGDATLAAGLIERARRVPSEAPTQQDAFESAFVLLALGVLGGTEALAALEHVGATDAFERLTEPYQVLRAARLTGNRLETPLAFALPVEARSIRELARIIGTASPRLPERAARALADRKAQLQPTGDAAVPLRDQSDSADARVETVTSRVPWVLGAGAVAAGLVAAWVWMRRREARRG